MSPAVSYWFLRLFFLQAAGLAGPMLFKRGLDVLSESSKAQGYSKAAMYAAVSALVLSGVSKVSHGANRTQFI
jgi:hypothetical protein